MGADILERLEAFASVWPTAYDSDRQNIALLREAAAEIGRLRGEVDKLKILLDGLALSATIAPAEAKGDLVQRPVAPHAANNAMSPTQRIEITPQPADGGAVAWLEVGELGYLDLGSDMPDDELRRLLGPGKHRLSVAWSPSSAAVHAALCFLGELEAVGNNGASDIARGLRHTHPPAVQVQQEASTLAPKVVTEVPSKDEAHAAIATAISDAIKALRVLSTMLRKEKLQQGFMVADEILGSLGYAEKMNAALAAHPQAAPVQAAPQEEGAVAYLEIGPGGYLDLGTDRSDDSLLSMPPGKYMLGIIGHPSGDAVGAALRFLGELETVGNARAGEVARGLRKVAAHPSACELGAVRELAREMRHVAAADLANEPGSPAMRDALQEYADRICVALQHRGDSRGGEG